jgi:uncharacterized delta-60 repeat protein
VLVVRYNPDGSPDATFGDGGRVVISTIEGKSLAPVRATNPADNPPPAALAVLGDDRILIATTTADSHFALARLTPQGSPDPAFGGGDGFAVVTAFTAAATGVAPAPGGKFIVTGNSGSFGTPGTVYVARFTAEGAIDLNTFGVSGYTTGPSGLARAVAVAPDGTVTVGASTGAGDFLVLRYLADGQPDRSFHGNGQATADFGAAQDILRDLAVLPDGSVIAAGGSPMGLGVEPRTTGDFAVVKLTAAGVPDTAFGAGDGAADGMLKVDFAGAGDAAQAVAVDSLGRVIVAGGAYVPGRSSDFALVRLEGDQAPGPVVESASLFSAGWSANFRSALAGAGTGADGGFVLQRASFSPILPWTGLDRIMLHFRGPFETVKREDLSVRGTNVANYAVADFEIDPVTHVATWRLAQPVENDRILIGLNVDADAAAEYQWRTNVLAGDSGGDGVVNATDLGDLKRRLNRSLASPGTGTSAYSVFADITGDGKINALDLGAVKQRLNRRLPAASPATTLATRDFFGSAPILPA